MTVLRRTRAAAGATGLVALVVALVLGAGAGTAFAFFVDGGTGTGTITAGTVKSVTLIGASGTVVSKLVPGGTADLIIDLDNPNATHVIITSISQSGRVAVFGGQGCTSHNSEVFAPTERDLHLRVATGTHIIVHVSHGAAMGTASASGCQGASFHIPVSVTVQP